MSKARLSILVAIGLVFTACAPGRLADLRDSFKLSAGLGFGLSADAKAGALTHPSVGIFSAAAMLGWDSRDVYGEFFEARVSEPYATDWDLKDGVSVPDAINHSGFLVAFDAHLYTDAFAGVLKPIGQDLPVEVVG